MSKYFQLFTPALRDQLLSVRAGETKLGQHILLAADAREQTLQQSAARYVLIGIPEDIGVRANYGTGGAHTAWRPALKALLNIQSTERFKGDELLVLGAFDFSEWMAQSEQMDTAALRELVPLLDEEIYPLIRTITAAGKIPIVIGGGHNNAYPLLKGAALGMGGTLSCINLDAHSDYRAMEGRHSGNGFRYAQHDGYLERYAAVGLHENYNSREIIAEAAASEALSFTFFEDIFIRKAYSFEHTIGAAIQHTSGHASGIELDLDCIGGVLSSAATPSGITAVQARSYLYYCAAIPHIAYLHLAEGAVTLRDGRCDPSTGKLIAYLVSDFIKARQEQQ